jgi:hypothetical protein
MKQQEIDKHLDSINRNKKAYKRYSKFGGLLRLIAAKVTKDNIRNDQAKLKKLSK